MKNYKRAKVFALIIIAFAMLVGCSEKGTESTPTPTISIATILPTYTPTPLPLKDPAVTDVHGDALGMLPSLSGSEDAIWQLASPIVLDRVAKGKGDTTAEYRFLWTKTCLYVQVTVSDVTKDTSGKTYSNRDSVVFYLNEDGAKNKKYAVGDAYYVVDRDGTIAFGTGCNAERFRSVVYEIEGGYVVEVSLPLLTITGEKGRMIGFDVRVNDANKGKLVKAVQWSDKSNHTDVNLRGVGELTFE